MCLGKTEAFLLLPTPTLSDRRWHIPKKKQIRARADGAADAGASGPAGDAVADVDSVLSGCASTIATLYARRITQAQAAMGQLERALQHHELLLVEVRARARAHARTHARTHARIGERGHKIAEGVNQRRACHVCRHVYGHVCRFV